jgi:hypothetical protein
MGGGTARATSPGVIDGRWFARVSDFLGGFPEDYLVFDCETNGADPKSPLTLPTQLGWAMVRGRTVVHEGAFLLNWALLPDVDEAWYAASITETADRMALRGAMSKINWQDVRDRGEDPRTAVPEFRALLDEVQQEGYHVVGHNGYGFDRPIVEMATRMASGDRFRFDYRTFVDTGMIEKSHAAGIRVPEPGEVPPFRWYEAVKAYIGKGKWNLTGCIYKYGLHERHGLDPEGAHDAGFDCRVTHLLLETYRELADSCCKENDELSSNGT